MSLAFEAPSLDLHALSPEIVLAGAFLAVFAAAPVTSWYLTLLTPAA